MDDGDDWDGWTGPYCRECGNDEFRCRDCERNAERTAVVAYLRAHVGDRIADQIAAGKHRPEE